MYRDLEAARAREAHVGDIHTSLLPAPTLRTTFPARGGRLGRHQVVTEIPTVHKIEQCEPNHEFKKAVLKGKAEKEGDVEDKTQRMENRTKHALKGEGNIQKEINLNSEM